MSGLFWRECFRQQDCNKTKTERAIIKQRQIPRQNEFFQGQNNFVQVDAKTKREGVGIFKFRR